MSASAVTAGLILSLAGERALIRCVLASIALHVLVLLGLSWRGAAAPPAKALLVLTARLVPFAGAPHAPVQPPPPKPSPPPLSEPASAPRPALTKPAVKPAPVPQNAAPSEAAHAPQPESVPAATSPEAPPPPVAAPVETRP